MFLPKRGGPHERTNAEQMFEDVKLKASELAETAREKLHEATAPSTGDQAAGPVSTMSEKILDAASAAASTVADEAAFLATAAKEKIHELTAPSNEHESA